MRWLYLILCFFILSGCGNSTSSTPDNPDPQLGDPPQIIAADTFVCTGVYAFSPWSWHYDVTGLDRDLDIDKLMMWVYLPNEHVPHAGPIFFDITQLNISERYWQNAGYCGNGISTPKINGTYKVKYQLTDEVGNESPVVTVYRAMTIPQ